MSFSSGAKFPPETSPYYKWPASSRGTICFSIKNYDRAHEVLLQQTFANRTAAARSTKKWKEEIAVLGGINDWSFTVTGKKEYQAPSVATTNGVVPMTVMGVRKKRKPDTPAAPVAAQEASTDSVQTLGEGLVRKKAKIEPTPVVEAGAANGVNTLTAGLVRKKPKP
jgi:regulator of Ty1 transposition protein 109